MIKGKKVVAAVLASLALSAAAAAAPRPVSEQIQVLAQTANSGQEGGWFVTPEKDANWNLWFYTVTDFDRDGKIEIFKAKRGKSGEAERILVRTGICYPDARGLRGAAECRNAPCFR